MSEVLQANIFFFITAVSVVVLTIFVGVALFYFIQILRNVRDISNKAKRASDVLGKDLNEFRQAVKAEGLKTKNIFDFLVDRFVPKSMRRKTTRRKKASTKKEGSEH